MTKQEIVDVAGSRPAYVAVAIVEAGKVNKDIRVKASKARSYEVSYTREEVREICGFLRPKMNELQIELVLDNYVEHENTYEPLTSPWLEGTEKALDRMQRDPKYKACCVCQFLHGRTVTGQGTRLQPWCSFYQKFVMRMRVKLKNRTRSGDIFKDVCPSFKRGDFKYFTKQS